MLQLHRKRNQSDRVIFNGIDLSSLVMCRVQRPIMAEVSPTFEEIPGRNGSIFKSVKRKSYTLPVEIYLRTEDRREIEHVRHDLAEALWVDEPAPLYLPDDPTRYLMAIVTGSTDLDVLEDDCPTTTINFYIGDPDYYGQKHRLSFTNGGTKVFAVGGNLPAWPVLTVKPTTSSLKITNSDTGEFVKLKTTSGATVVLDFESEHATSNGSVAQVSDDSDYFTIKDRAHLVIEGGASSVIIDWVERWH